MNNTNRMWMYERKDDCGCVSSVFIQGVKKFMDFSTSREKYMDEDKIKFPCMKCHIILYVKPDKVKYHVYKSGFVPNYWFWINMAKHPFMIL